MAADAQPTDPGDPERILGDKVLEHRRTRWQTVEIRQHEIHGNQLVIDGDLQISESDRAYNTAMVAPLLTLPDCRNVAVLGGGDGGVLREVLVSFDRLAKPLERVTLIDIDGAVIEVCRRWMQRLCDDAFDDPRANIVIGDAFGWIEQARNLDAVIYDLTMDPVREGMSRIEFIREILGTIHASLKPGGVLSLQACGEWVEDRNRLLSELHSGLEERFEEVREQVVMVPSYVESWTFLAARKSA